MLYQTRSRTGELDSFQMVAMLLRLCQLKPSVTDVEDKSDLEDFIRLVCGGMLRKCDECKPRQMASAIYALGKLQHRDEQLMQAFTDRLFFSLSQLDGRDLSTMIWGMTKLQWLPYMEWMDEFVRRSKGKLAMFKPVELANTINSLITLGYGPTPEWCTAFVEQLQNQLPLFRAPEIITVLYGLARLGCPVDQDTLAAVEASLVPHIPLFRAADLNHVIFSFSQWDYRPGQSWLEAFQSQVLRVIKTCSGSDLATILHCLAYLQVRPSEGWLDQVLEAQALLTKRTPPDSLADLVGALASFQYVPARRWVDALLTVIESRLDKFSVPGLIRVGDSLAALSAAPRVTSLVEAVRARVAQIGAVEAAEYVATSLEVNSPPSEQWDQQVVAGDRALVA